MIRATGWTVLKLERQPVADVFDLLAQLREDPPAHLILAAVHLEKREKRLDAAKSRDQLEELAEIFGQRPMPIGPELGAKLDEIARIEALVNKAKAK